MSGAENGRVTLDKLDFPQNFPLDRFKVNRAIINL
jgi:hypothetical protein